MYQAFMIRKNRLFSLTVPALKALIGLKLIICRIFVLWNLDPVLLRGICLNKKHAK